MVYVIVLVVALDPRMFVYLEADVWRERLNAASSVVARQPVACPPVHPINIETGICVITVSATQLGLILLVG